MKTSVRWSLVTGFTFVLLAFPAAGSNDPRVLNRPELEYLKEVNRAGPARDPQVLFLLMAQYANANRHREGIEFLSSLSSQFASQLTEPQKALYLSATALLRAQHATQVSFFKRIQWVRDTVGMLDDAKRLSNGEVFVVRWISGVVKAQLPSFFGQKDEAIADLQWCVENVHKAPHEGWLREVYYQLAVIDNDSGNARGSQDYLRLSGYKSLDKPITLVTPFSEDPLSGHTFAPKRIREVVAGKVYALSGFEFTEYYFIVSNDGRELIGIDAGTRADSAQLAYQALRAYAPSLPPLTTVLVTHAHWDHVGGHRYFRGLSPKPRFYARENFHDEIAIDLSAPRPFLKYFFGEKFSLDDVRSFKPDITIARRTDLIFGGTRVELIPMNGGETQDALFIYFPEDGVLFVGDFIMPYLGAPFVEEGNFDGLLQAIDVIAQKNPRHLLHGHEPLTRLFDSPGMLTGLAAHLAWLKEQVTSGIKNGVDRASLQQANLIPPGLVTGDPATHVPYLVLRENVINRLYDQHAGYWQPDFQGVDYLSRADRGSMLVDYLGVSEGELATAARRMIDDGRHELAASMLDTAKDRFPDSAALTEVERLVYLKLKEKYQDMNPFKFILYSGRIADPTPEIQSTK